MWRFVDIGITKPFTISTCIPFSVSSLFTVLQTITICYQKFTFGCPQVTLVIGRLCISLRHPRRPLLLLRTHALRTALTYSMSLATLLMDSRVMLNLQWILPRLCLRNFVSPFVARVVLIPTMLLCQVSECVMRTRRKLRKSHPPLGLFDTSPT